MQLKKLSAPLTAIALALATAFTLPRPNLAQRPPKYFCGPAYGLPATLVRTEVQNYILIHWVREIGGVSPEKRCEEISNRFERFDRSGLLKYLRTDTVNGSPVICVTEYRDRSCSSTGVLITLDQKDDANEILRDLLNTRVTAGSEGSQIYLSPEDERIEPLVGDDGSVSVDIQLVIDFFTGQESRVLP
ncbi:MAG: COP23 domain-containing protein [Bacteroidota bacterium]